MADLQTRTIKHGSFRYTKPSGARSIALRGDVVELGPDDIARGEKFDAFTIDNTQPQPAGTLAPWPGEDADTAEIDAWLTNGTVTEIQAAVSADPSMAAAVLAAELARGDKARSTLVRELEKLAPDPGDDGGDGEDPDGDPGDDAGEADAGDEGSAGTGDAETPARPAKVAPKPDWVAYAVAVDDQLSADAADKMTKNQLIDKYGEG